MPEFNYTSGRTIALASTDMTENTVRKLAMSKTPSAVKTSQMNFNKQSSEAVFSPNTVSDDHVNSRGEP